MERRLATSADREFVYGLMKEHMKYFFDTYAPERWSDERFEKGFAPERITILEENGMPIGFYDVEAKPNALYVHNAHISKEHRGHGYELQRYVDEEARKRGLKRLIAKVFTENKCGLAFVTKMGWQIVAPIKNEGSVWVERTLDSVCEEPTLS